MQNMNQTTTLESATNTHLSARYPADNHHPSLRLSNPEEIFPREHQHLTSTQQNKDHNLIPFEGAQKKNTKQDLQLLERNGYSIRLVDSFKQRIKTSTFIKHMYASRGYLTESTSIFSQNPYQFTFEACNKQQLLGTLTLTIDSNKGLLADQLYKSEIDAIRNRGKSICEVSKLAFNSNSNSSFNSKEIFASLFHIAYIYAYIIHGVNDAFIEINPRHRLFYKRMLGFKEIGEQRICQRVNAPAVLLHLEGDYMRNQITILAGQPKYNSKSIYPYFLNQYEQERITEKIQYLIIKQHSYSTCYQPKLVFSF